MVRPKKEEQKTNIAQAIINTAWRQIAEKGAAALSLRAIARDLNITAPAIYNHYHRRDDLVTALIVDAFRSLAESQKNSIKNIPQDQLEERFYSLGLGYREWAITYPQRYQLIFGTPIPNYEAPVEITVPVANEALAPLMKTIQAFYEFGRIKTEFMSTPSPELEDMLTKWQAAFPDFDSATLYLTLVVWSRVHGMVSMEISRHFPGYIYDPGEIYQREVNKMLGQYFKE